MNILSPINFHAFFILYTLLIIYRVFYPFIKFISQILSSHCSHFLIQFIPLRPQLGDVYKRQAPVCPLPPVSLDSIPPKAAEMFCTAIECLFIQSFPYLLFVRESKGSFLSPLPIFPL